MAVTLSFTLYITSLCAAIQSQPSSSPPSSMISSEKRKQTLWYPMRITYGRDERMLRFKQQLDEEGLENFLPLKYKYTKTDDWDVKKALIPAIHGLIFVHASQEKLTELKMTRREFEPMHYYTNRFSQNENDRVLVIPDRQMDNFRRIYDAQDSRVALLQYTDFIAKPGKRVRITQGDFQGTVGTIKRIKKSQCVVVEIQGLAAMAITFVPPSWLEEIPESDYRTFMTAT